MSIPKRLGYYAQLARFDKPIGWLLLLWPTMWGLWAASDGFPSWELILIFFCGVFFSRAMGCCFNDMADQKFDVHVKRTKNRPLAAKKISNLEAIIVAVFFMFCCFIVWLYLSWPARIWSLFALVAAISYPFAKRFLKIPQLHLSFTYSLGIPVAYAEVVGYVPIAAWVLFLANFFWNFAYDTIYAMVDRDDDLKIGIGSSAISFGKKDVLFVSLSYFMTLLALVIFGAITDAKFTYYLIAIGMGAVVSFHFVSMINQRNPNKCFLCFRQNHWLGFIVLIGIISNHPTW